MLRHKLKTLADILECFPALFYLVQAYIVYHKQAFQDDEENF